VPPVEDRIPFVEHLLALPRVSTNRFIGLSKEAALAWVKDQGTVWNEGNPWTSSDKIYDQLRGRLGFWKALGASKAVISWLAYGVPMYFIKEPQHVIFPNHVMDKEAKTYIHEDFIKHRTTGCFVEAPKGSVKVVNPILAISQGGKWRRCDDCRHCNALQATSKFCMCSLEKDVPTITEPGDEAVTEDLEKAFYKVPLAKGAQGYAAFEWLGIFWVSMVMLFGMCQAPFYFTRISKPMAAFFGAVKIPALNYIDDWYWPTRREALEGLHKFLLDFFHSIARPVFRQKGAKGHKSQALGVHP